MDIKNAKYVVFEGINITYIFYYFKNFSVTIFLEWLIHNYLYD